MRTVPPAPTVVRGEDGYRLRRPTADSTWPPLWPTGSSLGSSLSIPARYFSASPSESPSRWTPGPPRPSALGPARHYLRFGIWRPPSERQEDFNLPEHCAAQRTVWLVLTSRAAGWRRPFRRKARSPQVRPLTVPAPPPDLRPRPLGRKRFAVTCPLALGAAASYPVPVRRRGFVPRFPQRLPHGWYLAVPLDSCDQVPGGLPPPRHAPCLAHKQRGPRNRMMRGPFPRKTL